LSRKSPPDELMASSTSRLAVDVAHEDGRYHRQELISWWSQDRLASARILVVGAGALGNELVKNLALLGVGKILVIDLDRIENSNLSRCVLFRESDEGEYKATVVARAAKDINPRVRVRGIVGDVRVDLGLGVFASADLVLGGLDNREARLHLNQSCWKVGTPFIDGAIEGLMGTVRLFLPPDSACYECTMNERDHQLIANRRSCALLSHDEMLAGKTPTTAATASVIAAMQVQEAVKLLHRDRVEPTLAGCGFAYNGLTHDSYVVTYARRDDCLSHDSFDAGQTYRQSPDETLELLLERARQLLGCDAVLELGHELVEALECVECGTRDSVIEPVERLSVRMARCPQCGEVRRPVLTHQLGEGDERLLNLTPAELGLPRFEMITARADVRRVHFLIGGDDNAFDALMHDG
jgi:molybdopterin/thiamine biosynthesis adenylyltransferase